MPRLRGAFCFGGKRRYIFVFAKQKAKIPSWGREIFPSGKILVTTCGSRIRKAFESKIEMRENFSQKVYCSCKERNSDRRGREKFTAVNLFMTTKNSELYKFTNTY